MNRRVLLNLPVTCTQFSPSPYVDLNLFSYNDKFVSAHDRPKHAADAVVRFGFDLIRSYYCSYTISYKNNLPFIFIEVLDLIELPTFCVFYWIIEFNWIRRLQVPPPWQWSYSIQHAVRRFQGTEQLLRWSIIQPVNFDSLHLASFWSPLHYDAAKYD